MCLVGLFIRAGINANWLLTGEGPMLLADLVNQEQLAALRAQAAKPAPPDIDEHLLALCIQGIFQANPSATPEHAARNAVEFYGRLKAMKMEKPAAA